MAIQTRSASQKATNNDNVDVAAEDQAQADTPPPNRAARRAAQKKENKESKAAKITKTTRTTRTTTRTNRSVPSGSKSSRVLNPKTTNYE